MPKATAYCLIWSQEHGTYELSEGHHAHALPLSPGSHEWFAWLATIPSFTFQGQQGQLTVRQEQRPRGGTYWYAYHRVGAKMTKRYLGKTSEVTHDGKTIFKDIPSAMTCTRYHSLIVAEEGLPEELEISARTFDGASGEGSGGATIMALRHRELPIEGVQFHPESVLTAHGKKLIENFLHL